MSYAVFPAYALEGKEMLTHVITDVGSLHSHEFFEIAYALNGKIRHVSLDGETFLDKTTMIILRPGDIHAFDEQNNKKLYHRDILVSKEFFKKICDFISPTIYNDIVSRPKFLSLFLSDTTFNYMESILKSHSGTKTFNPVLSKNIAKIIMVNIINVYLSALYNQSNAYTEKYNEIIYAMHDPNILQNGIPALLSVTHYSYGHLCRIVNECSGKKLLDVLSDIRMEYAAILLSSSTYTMLEIAAYVGYDSLSHFITTFKKKYGIPPGKYQKIMHSQAQSETNDRYGSPALTVKKRNL